MQTEMHSSLGNVKFNKQSNKKEVFSASKMFKDHREQKKETKIERNEATAK